MSFLNDIKTEISAASEKFDIRIDKLMLFESTAYNNYNIREKEIFLEAYKNDDFDNCEYLIESEGESFKEKTKQTIDKIIETVKEFVKKCKDKIMEILAKLRDTGLVKKLEEMIKDNPALGKLKVNYDDVSDAEDEIDKEYEKSKKRVIKLSSGKSSDDDDDDMDNQENKIDSKFGKGVKIGAIVISVAALIALSYQVFKSTNTSVDADIEKTGKLVKSLNPDVNDHRTMALDNETKKKLQGKIAGFALDAKSNAEVGKRVRLMTVEQHANITINRAVRAAKIQAKLGQMKEHVHVEKVVSMGEALKSALSTVADKAKDIGNTVANTAKNMPHFSRESADVDSFDSDSYFSELCNDIFGESVEESPQTNIDTLYSELCDDIFFK